MLVPDLRAGPVGGSSWPRLPQTRQGGQGQRCWVGDVLRGCEKQLGFLVPRGGREMTEAF